MARLILLNGPPGIGKSTISALYTDRHPGTLNLDIDSLHGLVGGWRDPDNRTHDVLRPVALAMAATHLSGGREVVLPQYLATVDEIESFANVAETAGARFREFILLDGKDESIARFDSRPDDTDWERSNRAYVAAHGGSALLGGMYERLLALARLRPSAVIIACDAGAIETTYTRLVDALGD